MSANATLAVTDPVPTPGATWCTHLAPLFGPPWKTYVGPVPKGYWATARLDSGTGAGVLGLGAKPHPPTEPLTIGWFWAGWTRQVSVIWPTVFVVDVHCDGVTFNGSGTWVPRCFLTLRKVGGRPEDIFIGDAVLSPGRSVQVTVIAPGSTNLADPVLYDLEIAFNVRASYKGATNPQGELRATIQKVKSCIAFPTAAEGASELAAEVSARQETEGGGLDAKELASALAELASKAKVFEIESDQAALTGGLVSLEV